MSKSLISLKHDFSPYGPPCKKWMEESASHHKTGGQQKTDERTDDKQLNEQTSQETAANAKANAQPNTAKIPSVVPIV